MDERKAKIVKPAKEEEKTFAQKLSDFIVKNKTIFIAVIAVVLITLLGVAGYEVISNSIVEKSARAMESARSMIAEWNAEEDEAKKTEIETKLITEIDSIAKKWPKSFAAQQALFSKAGFYAMKKDWENAEKTSVAAAEVRTKSYLAPFALESAAVAAEEQGKSEEAISYYTKIVTTYTVDTPNLAHAHFSLGRLNEAKSEWKSAIEHYENLVASFADSDWALLAKNRLIYLKSKGYDK